MLSALIVDDEEDLRGLLVARLEQEGFSTEQAGMVSKVKSLPLN